MKIAVILSVYDKMSAAINNAVNKANSKLSSFAKKTNDLADKSFKTGQQLVASGLAVAAPLYKAYEAAQDFETKMVDIRKQMAADTPKSVKEMTADIFKLGKELPLATSEIQDMIAAGLRMGVAQDKVIGFTRDVAKMSVAFDMSAGEIADQMGKIANVFKIPIDKIGDFADAINYLDDNTMAKGPELIDVLQRIGGSAKSLSANQAAALASTMLSLGESAETSGSGISNMINRLSAATMQGKKFRDGLNMLGLNAGKLQKQMADKSTAQSAILQVFEKIQGLRPEKQTEALVRLFGAEHGPKMMKLANNVAEYRRQLELVNGKEKGSMNKEYQKRIQSSAAQMQLFKNRISELGVKIGTNLLPTVNKIIAKLGVWMDKIGAFIEKHPVLVSWIVKAAAAFSALAIVGGYIYFVVGGVARFFSLAANVAKFLTTAIGWISKAFQFLRIVMLTNPVLLIIIAIAVAAFLIIKYWDKIKAFFVNLWGHIKRIFSSVWQWIKNLFLNYTPHGLIIKHWDKIKAFFSGLWQRVKAIFMNHVKWVMNLGTTFYNAGKNIVLSIWNGIKAFAHKPVEMIKNIVGKIRNLLPFSPAKDGPLKDLHKIRLIETVAESIKPASLLTAMKKVTGIAFTFLNKSIVNPSPVKSASGGGGSTQINFTIHLNGGATKQDANIIIKEIEKRFPAIIKKYNSQQARVAFS